MGYPVYPPIMYPLIKGLCRVQYLIPPFPTKNLNSQSTSLAGLTTFSTFALEAVQLTKKGLYASCTQAGPSGFRV